MSSRIERKEDVVELYQYGRLYLRAFLGSGRVGIETQGVGNPVVDTYDLREFIKVVDLAYAEAAAEQTQTEAKPESLEEESPAAVPVDGEARIPDPGLTREEATSIGPGFWPITEATPCACGAIQPCHYCPVNASARAKLRASLAAADKGENDG